MNEKSFSEYVNEGFFKSAYERYVQKVLKLVAKFAGQPIELTAKVEDWIKDFYEDKFDPVDCAHAVADHCLREGYINTTQPLKEEVNMDREDELFIAKKTAERAGYKVEMPKAAPSRSNAIADNAARIAALKQRMGVAEPRPAVEPRSTAADLEKLAMAARTAEKAGFAVRKMTDVEQAMQVAQDAGLSVRKIATVEPTKPVETKPAEEKKTPFDHYFAGASRFLGRED